MKTKKFHITLHNKCIKFSTQFLIKLKYCLFLHDSTMAFFVIVLFFYHTILVTTRTTTWSADNFTFFFQIQIQQCHVLKYQHTRISHIIFPVCSHIWMILTSICIYEMEILFKWSRIEMSSFYCFGCRFCIWKVFFLQKK